MATDAFSKTTTNVLFAEATDLNKAKGIVPEGEEAPNLTGAVIFVKEDENASRGKIVLNGVEYGGGGDDTPFDSGTTTGVEVGGLPANTNIGNKSVHDVLDMIVNPEYAPYFITSDNDIRVSVSGGTLREVGTDIPNVQNDYTVEGITTKIQGKTLAQNSVGDFNLVETTQGDQGITLGGNLTVVEVKTVDGVITETVVTDHSKMTKGGLKTNSEGTFTVKFSQDFTEGTTNVNTSKGKPTRMVGGSATSRVLITDSGLSNNIKVSNTYKVKAGDPKSATHTVTYIYPIYATTGKGGALTKQGLSTNTTQTFTLKKNVPAKIAIPSGYSSVQIYEPGIGGSGWLHATDLWVKGAATTITGVEATSTVGATVAPADADSTYYIYERSSVISDNANIKIVITK